MQDPMGVLRSGRALLLLLSTALLCGRAGAAATPQFQDVSSMVGLPGSVGAAWGDYDGDGDADLFLPALKGPDGHGPRLLRNDGGLSFTDVSGELGFSPNRMEQDGAAWGDYDNDGDRDLLVGSGAGWPLLFRRDTAGFTEVARAAGFHMAYSPGRSVSWCDYDGDNVLDAFCANLFGRGYLMHNNGDGTFAEVAKASGLWPCDYGQSAAWGDYNNDGWPDLLLARMNLPTLLFRNNGDGTFTNVGTGSGVSRFLDGFSAIWGDYDNDGWLDCYVTSASYLEPQTRRDALFHNNGDGTFTDVSVTAGMAVDASVGLGAAWADYDNDGWLDLFVSNVETGNQAFLYHNNGDGSFTEVAAPSGMAGSIAGEAAAWADADRDGKLDLFQGVGGPTSRLFHNTGPAGNWLRVQALTSGSGDATGDAPVRDAIGARVEVNLDNTSRFAAGHTLTRLIDGGSGFLGQNEQVAHFGLGRSGLVAVRVRFPDGSMVVQRDVPANQQLVIRDVSARRRTRAKAVPSLSSPSAVRTTPAPPAPLTVGVLPFAAKDEKLAAEVSDIIAADLSRDSRISLVERGRLGEVLAELGLSASGVGDPETAQKVGFLAGAKVLVWGRLSLVNEQAIAVGGVVGVETGRAFVEQARGPRDGNLVVLIDQLAAGLASRILSERRALVAAEDEESLEASLNALAERLKGSSLPEVTVAVEGGVAGSPLASGLGTELMMWLVRCGFPVVEAPASAGIVSKKALVLLKAEASVAPGDHYGPLQTAHYRLQVRAVSGGTGEVIAVARRAGESAEVTREAASMRGLQAAATSIAAELLPKLAAARVNPAPPTPPAATALPLEGTEGRVLLAFTPYTPAEEAVTYYENGTHRYAWGRGVAYDARLTYMLHVPAGVDAAACIVTVDNMFLIRVARDNEGKPGEWHEELNAAKLFSRKIRDSENRMAYTIGLTPYLEDNPSRTIYLSVRPTQYYDAETAVYRVAVVALDEEERGRIEQRRRRLDDFLQHDREQHLLVFQTDGGTAEAPYLCGGSQGYQSHLIPYGRTLESDEYVIYRLPLTREAAGGQLCALIDNTFIVSLALEQEGKPGEFREAARSGARLALDITREMIAAGAVYLKFQYSRPSEPGGIVIREISIVRP